LVVNYFPQCVPLDEPARGIKGCWKEEKKGGFLMKEIW
jgi:hypothetical protein